MAHIKFILFNANVELSHTKGKKARVLPTNLHAPLVECCPQGCKFPNISSWALHQQASVARQALRQSCRNLP